MSLPRLQRSTIVAATVLAATGLLYLVVRPEAAPVPGEPPIPVFVVPTTTVVPADTVVTTTSVAPGTDDSVEPGVTPAPSVSSPVSVEPLDGPAGADTLGDPP
jgi:hypothetical protein